MIKLASISDINDDLVKLKLKSDTNCSDCKSRCSDGFLSFLFHKKNKTELLIVKQHAFSVEGIKDIKGFFNSNKKVGDTVGVRFSERYLMRLSVMLYALPIVLILILLPLTYILGPILMPVNPDLSGLVGLVSALVISKYLLHLFRNQFKIKIDFF